MPSTTQLAVLDELKGTFGASILEVTEHVGDVFVLVSRDAIIPLLTHLKDTHRFIYLSDLFGVDRFTADDRFEVVYNLVSLATGTRLFVKTRVPEDEPVLPTAVGIWSGANWNEREVYDMFGVRFDGHPDPRRIFMPEDFEYFPLRKEFPLLGIPGSIELPNTTPDPENT
jgi:NADH-quinone oxidoreductase subunit C